MENIVKSEPPVTPKTAYLSEHNSEAIGDLILAPDWIPTNELLLKLIAGSNPHKQVRDGLQRAAEARRVRHVPRHHNVHVRRGDSRLRQVYRQLRRAER